MAEPAEEPFTVGRYGGVYAITLEPWPWWMRPRWAWRLLWRLRDHG